MKSVKILLATAFSFFFFNPAPGDGLLRMSLTISCHAQESLSAGSESFRKSAIEPESFMKANFEFALHHEMAHALFDVLDIPVLGNEEFAADHFALLVMLNPKNPTPEDEFLKKVIAVSGEWLVEWREECRTGNVIYWDTHPLTIQRFFDIGCLAYGNNPELLESIRKEQRLPTDRMLYCERDYLRFRKSIKQVFQHWGRKDANTPPSVVIQTKLGEVHTDFGKKTREWLVQSRLVEKIADKVSHMLQLPNSFTIEISECGNPEAYWNFKSQHLVIAYELAEQFWINAGKVEQAMLELKENKRHVLTVSLTGKLNEQLQEIAKLTGKGKEEIIEQVLNQGLQNNPD
ncbi:MAG: hypothetical protein HN931_03160 [Desulfobacterales bacterium]|nr:hypothetical protein [Desulfobacterales bacterium]